MAWLAALFSCVSRTTGSARDVARKSNTEFPWNISAAFSVHDGFLRGICCVGFSRIEVVKRADRGCAKMVNRRLFSSGLASQNDTECPEANPGVGVARAELQADPGMPAPISRVRSRFSSNAGASSCDDATYDRWGSGGDMTAG